MGGVYRRAPMGARASLTDAWPLFGLRLRTERLELRLPTDDELIELMDLARVGIHPPDEMPFGVAWSTLPSPAFERGFMQHHWTMRGSWLPTDWTLNLTVEFEGVPVGTQTLGAREFAIHRTVSTGSWLGLEYQRRGFGREMRAAVLGLAFDGLGARVAESSAFLDNAASNAVSHALGYAENGLGSLAPNGIARATQNFRMTDEMWRARPRPPLTIEGLDACRELFGA
jgi:RimJ/RimL family protein N-acetyltransferase